MSSPPRRVLAALLAVSVSASAFGAGIDPGDTGARYAWAENAGWLNFRPAISPASQPNVGDLQVTGYAWAENLGWINLSCANSGACGGVDYGVTNNGLGELRGYAWAENAGWISFSCANRDSCGAVSYGVSIDPRTGVFSGKAWGENIGWISFDPAGPYAGIVTGWRALDSDGDGVFDANDNCTLVANASQCDSDDDGYGNRCDGDLNNNGSTNAQDTVLFRQQLGQPSVAPGYNVADLNCSGAVNAQDTTLFRQRLGSPPGPAGLLP